MVSEHLRVARSASVVVPAVNERSPGAPTAPASDGVRELDANLDQPLPDDLTVGAGSALFVKGRCAAPHGLRVKRLTISLDSAEHPLMGHGISDRRAGD